MASDPLTRKEAMSLIDMTGRIGRPFAARRDQAALVLMYRCGLRSNECRMLDLTDLRSDPCSIRVRFPKGWERGAPPREVGIDDRAMEFIRGWLEIRGDDPGPLFCTRAGRRLDTSHWRRKVKVSARAAGIPKRVHLHGLRHTFARMLHDEGVSVRIIKDALGHRSLATTDVYLGSLGSPEVVAVTSRRSWDSEETQLG